MRTATFLFVLLVGVFAAGSLSAQDADDAQQDSPRRRAAEFGRPEGQAGFGGPGGFLRMFPMFAVLDTNEDGQISARELKKAMTQLRTLDANQDGNLTEEELRPQFPGGPGGPGFGPGAGGGQGDPNAPGGRGGQAGQGGQGVQGGKKGQGPRGFGGPGAPAGPGGGGFTPPTPESLVERWMMFDADQDGKLSSEELTAMARQFLSPPQFGGQPGQDQPNNAGEGRRRRGRPQQPPGEDRPPE